MAVKLTDEQLKIVKMMIRWSESFANNMLHIMENHGLDKIDGCHFDIQIVPQYEYLTCKIDVGERRSDFGEVSVSRGKNDAYYNYLGSHSAEYEILSDGETVRTRKPEVSNGEKPLPPDGLWIGDPRNDCPVDSRWEWDVNDSLS